MGLSVLFSPVSAAIGGVLIGGSASALFRANGRILGMSGILKEVRTSAWKQAFVGGMLTTSGATTLLLGPQVWEGVLHSSQFSALTLASGLLVGFGTTVGSGCTSGHGVCGLSRLSKRSMVAVGTFFPVSMITANAFSRVDPLIVNYFSFPTGFGVDPIISSTALVLGGAFLIQRSFANKISQTADGDSSKSLIASAATGGVFASGLMLSGMTDPRKVLGFLDIFSLSGWDPSLAFVMMFAVAISFFGFRNAKNCIPLLRKCTSLPTNTDITPSLIIGSALFGIGWGIAGVCPGPGIVSLSSGTLFSLGWVSSMFVGFVLGSFWKFKK